MDYNETWVKVGVGALAFFTILLQIYLNWRKERQTDEAMRIAAKATLTPTMQTLAAIGTPMQALHIDQVNDLFKCVEKLCASMNQLATACDRHLEETRRAAEASARTAEESRRLQGVIEKAAGEAADRAAAAKRLPRS
jgi:hypothetical protein